MDAPEAQGGAQEAAEGSVCPNCGQGQLTSLKGQQEAMTAAAPPVQASLFPLLAH